MNAKRPPHHRLYGTNAWRVLRAQYLEEQPFCERCGAVGYIVHHRVSHHGDEGMFFDWGNLETVCNRCHEQEHKRGFMV